MIPPAYTTGNDPRARRPAPTCHGEVLRLCATIRDIPVAAFVILGVAVLLGSALAVLHLRADGAATPQLPLAVLHGLRAIIGLCCLALALRGPPRGVGQGMASFGLFATALLAVAALAGAGMLAARVLKKRISGDDDRHPGDARRERLGHLAVYVFAG